MKSKILVVLALSSMLFLTGCFTKYITKHKYIRQEVPESVIPNCPEREFNGTTIGDRLIWADKAETDMAKCSIDVDSLREWLEENPVEEQE